MKNSVLVLVMLLIICISSITTHAQDTVIIEKLENQLNKNYYDEIKELGVYLDREGEGILSSLSIIDSEFKPSYFNLDRAVKQYSEFILNEKAYDDISTIISKIKKGGDEWIVPVYDINDMLCSFVVFRRGMTLEQAETQNRWWPDKETKENYYESIIRNAGEWNFESGAINPPKDVLNKYEVIFDKELLAKKLDMNGINQLESISYIEFTQESIKALFIEDGKEKKYYILKASYSEILEDGNFYSEETVLNEIKRKVELRKEYTKSGQFRIGGVFLGEKSSPVPYIIFGIIIIFIMMSMILIYKRRKKSDGSSFKL